MKQSKQAINKILVKIETNIQAITNLNWKKQHTDPSKWRIKQWPWYKIIIISKTYNKAYKAVKTVTTYQLK